MHYRARHGRKGELGQKGSVSALKVLEMFTGIMAIAPQPAANQLSGDQIHQLVQEVADEFGLPLSPGEVAADVRLLQDGQTVQDFLVQWKERANTERSRRGVQTR